MKTVMTALTLVIGFASASFSQTAQAAGVEALNGICENVAANDKSRFRKKLKESGLKLRDVYQGITCGGENLVRYAMSNNAEDVGSFIVKRMPASHFASSGDLDWANTSGHAASPIASSIAAR
ncbi:DUF3718 domain-containing protein [Psychrosphaera sp. F3M07]|uniref:DUF3718 domain-containing protein n=1 Tax=Psychrosphaera sp. F3M07 TaxID=2841560 RepID=UPI001C08BF8C|nr:DUF3718 domain-containing protein [Psychrosphaera sp. F3M07]MBU2916351.1 DUF3718 domain-containing protein [Psychrosphaera sp. F3M07]